MVNASVEVGGSSPTRVKPCCVLEQGTFTPQKVLVIPSKRWLRPNMTEKLFTGTLRINQPTNQRYLLFGSMDVRCYYCPLKFGNLESAISHSTKNHDTELLRYRQLVLCPDSGHMKYQYD